MEREVKERLEAKNDKEKMKLLRYRNIKSVIELSPLIVVYLQIGRSNCSFY